MNRKNQSKIRSVQNEKYLSIQSQEIRSELLNYLKSKIQKFQLPCIEWDLNGQHTFGGQHYDSPILQLMYCLLC